MKNLMNNAMIECVNGVTYFAGGFCLGLIMNSNYRMMLYFIKKFKR